MNEKPIIFLGAGATKACGGPLTDEILPAALNGDMQHDDQTTQVEDRGELLRLTREFLSDCFNVPVDRSPVHKEDCPSLPMVLSMLHRSIELGLPLGAWQGERLIKAKRAIEYAVFAVIEAALRRIPRNRQHYYTLLEPLYENGVEPVIVSLNYDVIVDNAMFPLSDQYQGSRPPDYCVDIATIEYAMFRELGTFGKLLKIHGSLNWLYCKDCKRLDLFVSQGLKSIDLQVEKGGFRTAKALSDLYVAQNAHAPFNDAYGYRGTPCRNRPDGCKGFVSPILITPTYTKDYENPHVKRAWKEAERAMKEADRAVIIGYSLPTDDVEVAMLLKRGLHHLPQDRITVVGYEHGDIDKPAASRTPLGRHPVGRRFRTLFGPELDWHTTGFEGWLEGWIKEQKAA